MRQGVDVEGYVWVQVTLEENVAGLEIGRGPVRMPVCEHVVSRTLFPAVEDGAVAGFLLVDFQFGRDLRPGGLDARKQCENAADGYYNGIFHRHKYSNNADKVK